MRFHGTIASFLSSIPSISKRKGLPFTVASTHAFVNVLVTKTFIRGMFKPQMSVCLCNGLTVGLVTLYYVQHAKNEEGSTFRLSSL